MKKIIVTVLLCIIFFITLVVCKKDVNVEADLKDDLVIAIGSESDEGFDPVTCWGRYGNRLIQSTLIDTDKDKYQ